MTRTADGGWALSTSVSEYVIDATGGAPGDNEDLTGTIAARKDFVIDSAIPLGHATAAAVEINLYESPGNTIPLAVSVNDAAPLTIPPGQPEAGRYQWRSFPIDVALLRPGTNSVTLKPAAKTDVAAWSILIVRCDLPNRSARSLDGGRSWDFDRLGIHGKDNGEYTMRLRVSAPARATLLSGVARLSRAERLSIPTADSVAVRFGPTAVPDHRWSGWVTGEAIGAPPPDADANFVQYSTVLLAADARERPSAPMAPPADADAVTRRVNAWLPFGSRFKYQDPTAPALAVLRARERLDELVTGLGETRAILRVRNWARQQFPDGDPNPFPPLNALTILEWIRKGTTQGFCGQHAYVFGQALLSLGYQVRYVELGMHTPLRTGGVAYFPAVHFSVEYWSPRHAKWVFMDPNKNLHVTLDGRPLSAREVHDVYMEYFHGFPKDPASDRMRGRSGIVKRRPAVERRVPALGTVFVDGWDLEGLGLLEVIRGPAKAGGWSLDLFHYVRVRLRNDELSQPTQVASELPHVSPGTPGDINPNGMLEYEDPRALPLREPIALYSTQDADVFDWRLDVVDIAVTHSDDQARLIASSTWPAVSGYSLRTGATRITSAEGAFLLPLGELEGAVVEALDHEGRAVGRAVVGRR